MAKSDMRLGFGFMRLPMNNDMVDVNEVNKMVDLFISKGYTYFDTAHGYLNGLSEKALKTCVVDRYPRNSFTVADKLTQNYFKEEKDIRPLFESQLKLCGVEYFDCYLFHAMTKDIYPKFENCNAFNIVKELRNTGKIKHIGMSFHDHPALLEEILEKHPEIEFVQLQFNYADYYSINIESKALYDICVKYKKPVIVMEPLKGSGLVKLPELAENKLKEVGNESPANYAFRFVLNHSNVSMILSGMSRMSDIEENLKTFLNYEPLTKKEFDGIMAVAEVLNGNLSGIKCTACKYCVAGCPKHISIPNLFSCYNQKVVFKDWNSDFYYNEITKDGGKATDCIKCGKCEAACPQHLKIREILVKVGNTFEKKE